MHTISIFCGLQKLNTLNLRHSHPPLNPRNHFSTVLIKTNWYTISCKYSDCKSLTCIYIPDSVTTIYSGAFGNCNNIPSKIKSDIIKRFGKEVFESWPLLIPSAESAKTR